MLIEKMDNAEASQAEEKLYEGHDEAKTSARQQVDKGKKPTVENLQVSANGFIPLNKLKDFIDGTNKSKIEGTTKSSLTCAKPYTARIDNLKMSAGYQLSKFQQFDGMRNLK